MNYEQHLLVAALIKWANGEPLSTSDFKRILGLMQGGQLGLDQPSPDAQAALLNEIISTLNSWSENIQKQ